MKRMAKILLATSIAALSSTAFAQGYAQGNAGFDNVRRDYGRVLQVERVGGTYSNRISQECWNDRTNRNDTGYYRDNSGRLYRGDNSGKSGTEIGTIVGGMRQNPNARDPAGGRIDYHNDGWQDYQGGGGNTIRCRTSAVPDDSYGAYGRRGYRVTYEYAGQTYKTFTTVRPGRTIPLIVDVRAQ